jgi:hypothetical protein
MLNTSWVHGVIQFFATFSKLFTKANFGTGRSFILIRTRPWDKYCLFFLFESCVFSNHWTLSMNMLLSLICPRSRIINVYVYNLIFFGKGHGGAFIFQNWAIVCWTWCSLNLFFMVYILLSHYPEYLAFLTS